MIEHRGRVLDSLADRGDARVVEDLRLVDCELRNCHLSLTKDFAQRSLVRRIELIRCKAVNGSLGPAILEDVRVDGLATSDLLIAWGTIFRRVTLSGRIGQLKLNPWIDPVDRSERVQRPLAEFRERFYAETDWALDIREARFVDFDMRGIPASLVRRDPESQVVVTRERALRPGWREQLSPGNELWPFVLERFLRDGDPDKVLVAPLGAPKAKRDELLAGLHELRSVGVAEPD